MNKCIYTGRPTKDPDIYYSGNGEEKKMTVKFNFAVRRNYVRKGEADADFIPCVAFGKTAKIVADNIKKGTHILIIGQLRNNDYEKDGKKVYGFQLIVETIEFLEKKKEQERGEQEDIDGYMTIPDDAETPFH